MLKNIGIFGAVAAVSLAACSTRTIEREVIHTPAAQPTTVQVTPAPQPATVQVTPATTPVIVAAVQPPPAQTETVPPAPAADMVWIPGYWNYSNNQYVWVAGRYEPAKIGYIWAPNRWEHINGRWQMTGGAWVRQ
jgi:WXXGXW repeat (2 copies)